MSFTVSRIVTEGGKLALVLATVLLADHVASLALPKVVFGCLPIWCWLLPTRGMGYAVEAVDDPEELAEPDANPVTRIEPRLFPQ